MQPFDTNDANELRQRCAALEAEIARLKRILEAHAIPYAESGCNKEYGGKIVLPDINATHARLFYSFFKGRKDVYAKRNVTREGKGVYYPVCDHFWEQGKCPRRDAKKQRCKDCPYRQWTPLNQRALMRHLRGEQGDGRDVIGIYPLLENETCHLLVFDFDHHDEEEKIDWKREVDTLRELCHQLGIDALVERSRSGNGAHVWLFFTDAISAKEARQFGNCLLTQGAKLVDQKSFVAYDRMLPAQETLTQGGLGNLIALPLQGAALKHGNSAFVDESWQPYVDQWERLKQVKRISPSFVREKLAEWSNDGEMGAISRLVDAENSQPWKKNDFELYQSDVDGKIVMVDSCMLYVRTDNLKARLCNTLRRLSSFRNPIFYKNRAMGLSVKGMSRIIPCFDEDEAYIGIPRGKREQVLELCQDAQIPLDYRDIRNKGKSIRVSFNARLYPEQQKAADDILQHSMGILQAATAFGKTAVGAYLIATRKVNTLVLVHNREILKNWVEDLQKFLHIEEELPQYSTASGKVRQRKSHIGRLFASHQSLGGIVDVAMITSLGTNDDVSTIVRNYGMVIMDECHHGAAWQAYCVLKRVNATYMYGLTATPKRDDGMEQKVLMAFGPIRHRFTARQRVESRQVQHLVYPRFTKLCVWGDDLRIQELYRLAIGDAIRNKLIIDDVLEAVKKGRTPLVLTKFKAHAQILMQALSEKTPNLFLLQGGRSSKERDAIRQKLLSTPASESVVVVAIGQYIGEGFNFPRLDTLMLAAPIAWDGNVEQYAGRLHRDYEGKKEVIIYDYADIRIRVFDRMYAKRMRTYKRIGYSLYNPLPLFENDTNERENTFYEADTFKPLLERDILAARQEILISSTFLSKKGVAWLLSLQNLQTNANIRIIVRTLAPEVYPDREADNRNLIDLLMTGGIQVRTVERHHERFAIIDRHIVWYGNANILSESKLTDHLLRMNCPETAADIMLAMQNKQPSF